MSFPMKKPIYFLLGILLIFMVVYFLLNQKEKKTYAPGKVENFLTLDSASVDRIEFERFGTKLIFQKTKDRWYMVAPDSCRADNNAIGQMLGTVSHLEVGELISSNPTKQFLFQVDTLMGTCLDFFSGERQLASVMLGKMSDDYIHAYVRKTESDEVYLVTGLFSHLAERKIDKWKDRRIFPFDPRQVRVIELNQDEQKFKLTQEDTLWKLSPFPYQQSSQADAKLVDNYLQSLADMKGDEFATKTEIIDIIFKKPEFTLTLGFLDGHEEKLFAARSDEAGSRYYVKSDQDKSVSILFEYSFKRLAKKPEDFLSKKED